MNKKKIHQERNTLPLKVSRHFGAGFIVMMFEFD